MLRHGIAVLVLAGFSACHLSDEPITPLTAANLEKQSRPSLQVLDTVDDYETIDLGNFGGSATFLGSLNNRGQVVGGSLAPDHWSRAFVWEDGRLRDISPAASNVNSFVRDVNDRGVMVGGFGAGTIKALIWNNNDVPEMLETPEGWESDAVRINGGSAAIGQIYDGPSWERGRGALWQNGARIDLGVLVRPPVTPRDINDRGQIVGQAWADPWDPEDYQGHLHNHPFIWENGVMRDLGIFGAYPCPTDPTVTCGEGWAMAINDRGQVVGGAEDATGAARAFLWENGEMRDLGVRFRRHTLAVGINRHGVITGHGHNEHAMNADMSFVWENGVARDLGSLGGGFTIVSWQRAINDRGEIVGQSRTADGRDHPFVWRDGRMLDLSGSLNVALGGALTLNDRGDIIGLIWEGGSAPFRAVLWRRINIPNAVATP